MGLIELLLVIALVGCVAWFLATQIPMLGPFATLIKIIAAVFCVLILVRALGLDVAVPRIR